MHFLKEEIGTITYPVDGATAYANLLSKLAELHLFVEEADADRREVVVRCLTRLANAGIWRCWADKLIIQLKEVGPHATSVSISGIPNLMRIKIKEGESVVELDNLVAQLRSD